MAKFSSLDITRLLFSLKRELYKSMSSLSNNFKWSIGNETTDLLLCSLKLSDYTILIGELRDQMDKWKSGLQKYYKLN